MPPERAERRPLTTADAPETDSLAVKIHAAKRVPTAFVSLYVPAGRRTHWWYAYGCRTCGTYQLGRSRSLEDVTGERTAGCGHRVRIAVARVYGKPDGRP